MDTDDAPPSVPPGELERAADHRAVEPRRARLRRRPPPSAGIEAAVGDGVSAIPPGLRRSAPPALPELSQPAVLRHYLRLSQETLGQDVNIHLGLGTCTMKYSPKVNEALVRSHKVADLHPYQDDDTVQGILEALHRFEQILCEISRHGPVHVPAGRRLAGRLRERADDRRLPRGSRRVAAGRDHHDGLLAPVRRRRPGHGRLPARHAATPATTACPSIEALKAAISERTAGLMITNPEDTGIFNPQIDRMVELVHDAGGICHYDQANANGILGITRARDAGFDLCQFNLHKTFSSPHCLDGHAGRRVGRHGRARAVPAGADGGVRRRAGTSSTTTGPHSIGKVRAVPRRPGDAWCARTRGCSRSAPRGCARWRRSRC